MPSVEFGFLERTWAFLRDEDNRGVLQLFGGVAVAVIGAAWAVFRYRSSAKKSDNAGPTVKISLDEEKAARFVKLVEARKR